MKLLQVISSMHPRTGGTCQAVRALSSQIVEQGNSVEVVCLDDPNSEFLAHEAVPVHALGQGRGPWEYHPALPLWLARNLPRFDAVILNGLWQHAGYALGKAAQRPDSPPYFVFPHGMLDPWFQNTPGRRIKAFRNWLYWKLIERRVIHNAGGILFTCAEEMRLARETFRPYHPQRQLTVGLGTPRPPKHQAQMAEVFRQKCPGLEDKPFFLFLGRIDSKKGVDILIDAYAETCRSTPEAQRRLLPRLVMAGPAVDTEFGDEMKAHSAKCCPPGYVLWPGMLTGDAKWGALYRAEAFVLPSHQENFGIAVVEALACGTPVLISNRINIWREIAEDEAGLTASDTLDGTRDFFRRWLDLSPEAKAAMGRAAEKSYESRFTIELAAQNLLTAIERLMPLPQPKPLRESIESTA